MWRAFWWRQPVPSMPVRTPDAGALRWPVPQPRVNSGILLFSPIAGPDGWRGRSVQLV